MIKFIKCMVLLLPLLVVSKTTLATSSIEWVYLNNTVATVTSYREPDLGLSLVNLKGDTNLYISHRKGSTSLNKHCSNNTSVISVGGRLINFYVSDNKKYNICMYKPVTNKGKEFLISYFIQRENEHKDVSIEGNIFSTYGFNEVYSTVSKGHLQKAL